MKKVYISLFFLGVVFLVYYLFIKEEDYIVRFQTKAPSLLIKNELLEYVYLSKFELLDKRGTISYIDDSQKNTPIKVIWDLQSIDDSTRYIKVGYIDLNHSIAERMKVLLYIPSAIKKYAIESTTKFRNHLIFHLKKVKFKVHTGEFRNPKISLCLCMPAYVNQEKKASTMIQIDQYLMPIINHHTSLLKKPLLEILDWNIFTNKIRFNFCFPISQKFHLDENNLREGLFFKSVVDKKSIKATFYGNYKFTDRAWYALHDYAKFHHISIGNPIEYFHNNPHDGGNDIEWKAEVYAPIIE